MARYSAVFGAPTPVFGFGGVAEHLNVLCVFVVLLPNHRERLYDFVLPSFSRTTLKRCMILFPVVLLPLAFSFSPHRLWHNDASAQRYPPGNPEGPRRVGGAAGAAGAGATHRRFRPKRSDKARPTFGTKGPCSKGRIGGGVGATHRIQPGGCNQGKG